MMVDDFERSWVNVTGKGRYMLKSILSMVCHDLDGIVLLFEPA